MEKRRKIGLFSLFLSVLLTLQLLLPYGITIKEASSNTPKFKLLEIVATTGANSQFTSEIISKYNLEIVTIPMKKFVAQREELNGKYDGIAIVEGNYTSEGVKGTNHNTTNIMNDITNLKAEEIINDFINNGQLVILHKNSMSKGNKIKNNFKEYTDENQNNNILVYNNKNELNNLFKNFFDKYHNQRPRMIINKSEIPSETKKYVAGDLLSFTFDVQKPENVSTRDLKAQLYIDSDFNDRYVSNEIVVEVPVINNSTTITYKLPKGYSGIRNWKLELVDNATKLKDYQSGSFLFKDQVVQIKVLQVVANNNGSSLKDTKNMNQGLLEKAGEYKIDIDVITMAQFKSTYHSKINGNYDMVIFGFADMYNTNAVLEDTAVQSLKKYIASKQSIMFTHDTIFQSSDTDNNQWVKNFMGDTGQIHPKTNLGYRAPNKSSNTIKINDGLVTTYPNKLDENIKIALTHNQYFTLDLEDKEITPWFNITGSNRDNNDSYNHYYMYSKGNITYSGTGHTSSGFPSEEQQLFVNTMYRAFLGSNHAPIITELTPKENDSIPSNQNIELSYLLEDFDLQDTHLDTKVYLNDKEVFSKDEVANGSTIVTSLKHDMPDGGNAKIKITATDKRGAIAEKILNVKIVKVNASLEVNRTTNAANPSKVKEEVAIQYMITPKDITGVAAKNIKENEVTVTNLIFKEVFPANLEVSHNNKTGSLASGYTVEKKLGDIVYKRNGDKFTAQPVHFSIPVTPMKKKQYVLESSKISYSDYTKKREEASFNKVTIVADVPLTDLIFPESYVLTRDSTKKFALDLKYVPENAGIKEIQWSEDSGGKILQIDAVTGTATAIKEGSTEVRVTIVDVFGNEKKATALVTVCIPINDFTIEDITLKVGEIKNLPLTVDPAEGKTSLEMYLRDEQTAELNKKQFTITGLIAGETILVVSGLDKDGKKIEKVAKVIVEEIEVEKITVSPSVVTMNKNDTYNDFNVTIKPSNATNKKLVWTSLNNSIVKVNKVGEITGVGTGKAIVEVSTPNGKVKTQITVYVSQPLTGISAEDMNIVKGKSKKVIVQYIPLDASNVQKIEYKGSNDYYATVSPDGTVTGKRLGEIDIIVIVTTDEGKSFSDTLKVIIEDKENGGNSGDWLY